jgi:DNA-binding YbaB/EbfC family protein
MEGGDLMSKLLAMKELAEKSKEKLDTILIEGESGGGLVVITMNGNRIVKSIKINTDLKLMETEDLEDLICVAMQRVLEKVNSINEQEVMSSSKNLFPGM